MKRFCLVPLFVFMCSCAQTGFVKTDQAAPAQKVASLDDSVRAFTAEADLPAGAEKIGVVNVRGWQANTAWIIHALKMRARAEGGDAIVLVKVNPKGLFTYSYGTGEALVFKLKAKI
jgi:hypothetical protein